MGHTLSTAVGRTASMVSMAALRSRNTQDMVGDINYSEDYSDLLVPSQLLLRLCGILPWPCLENFDGNQICKRPSAWYQWLMLVFTLLAGGCSFHAVMQRVQDWAANAGDGLGLHEKMCYTDAC